MSQSGKTAITRREFARRAALAGAAATLGPAPAPGRDTTPAQDAVSDAKTGPPPLEASLRVQTIVAISVRRFSDDQKADLLKMSSVAQKSLDRLRAYQVQNGDDPALYLNPLMEREKKAGTAPAGASSATPAKKP
jgi:hypothetical protein